MVPSVVSMGGPHSVVASCTGQAVVDADTRGGELTGPVRRQRPGPVDGIQRRSPRRRAAGPHGELYLQDYRV